MVNRIYIVYSSSIAMSVLPVHTDGTLSSTLRTPRTCSDFRQKHIYCMSEMCIVICSMYVYVSVMSASDTVINMAEVIDVFVRKKGLM